MTGHRCQSIISSQQPAPTTRARQPRGNSKDGDQASSGRFKPQRSNIPVTTAAAARGVIGTEPAYIGAGARGAGN